MIIYKTTNLLNGKFYIGKDAYNRKNYLGSGILLNKAIKRYGIENFKKETIEECSNLDELAKREIYWIKKLKAIENGYNIAISGKGGDTISNHPNKDKIIKNIWEKRRNNPDFKKRCFEISTKAALTKKKTGKIVSPFKGKKHSNESKLKIKNKAVKNINDYPIDTINEIKNMYLSLESITNIKNRLHIGTGIIKKVIKNYNLSRNKKPVHNKKISLVEFKAMVDSHKNKEDIMNNFNISDRTYNRYFYKLGYSKKEI